MRLSISNLLVALLVLGQVEAGPLKVVRPRQQESSSPTAVSGSSADDDFGDFPDCDAQPANTGRDLGGGFGFGISDPQEHPSATPSPIFCRQRGVDDDSGTPTTAEPQETTTEASGRASSTGKTSDEPPNETTDTPRGTSTGSAGEESSAGGTPDEPTDDLGGSSGETSPTKTDGPVTISTEFSTGVSNTGLPTVTVTKTVKDDDGSIGTGAGATRTGTPSGGVFTSIPSSPAGTGTAAPSGGGDVSSASSAATGDGTDAVCSSPGTATEGPDPSANVPSSGASDTGDGTTVTPQPESSGATSNPPKPTITPTDTPNPDVPTVGSGRPTATTTVPAAVMDANIERAQGLNELYADLTPLSACSEGQVACIEGSFATCNGGAFELLACPEGSACMALPLDNVASVIIKCGTEEEAGVLGPGGVPSGVFSGSAGPGSSTGAPGESATGLPEGSATQAPSESPSKGTSQAPEESATQPASEGTQAPSQPGDEVTTTVTRGSTVIVTSTVTSPRDLESTVNGPLISSPSSGDPEVAPPPSTEDGAVIPTTVGRSFIETEAPSTVDGPSASGFTSIFETEVPSSGGGEPTSGESEPVVTEAPSQTRNTFNPITFSEIIVSTDVEDLFDDFPGAPTGPESDSALLRLPSPSTPTADATPDVPTSDPPSAPSTEGAGDAQAEPSPSSLSASSSAAEEVSGVTTVFVTKEGPTVTVTEEVTTTVTAGG